MKMKSEFLTQAETEAISNISPRQPDKIRFIDVLQEACN